MTKIARLEVTVTYKVGLTNVEIHDKVYDNLFVAAECGDEIEMGGKNYSDEFDWLNSKIKERDCMDWRAEITDVYELI